MVPNPLFAAYLYRFDELISKEETLQLSMTHSRQEIYQTAPVPVGVGVSESKHQMQHRDDRFDPDELLKWRINYFSLMQLVLPPRVVQNKLSRSLESTWWHTKNRIVGYLSILEGLMDNLENGLHRSLSLRLESEIGMGFIDQAEQLLALHKESVSQDEAPIHYHDVAAVTLAGAVLEKTLRSLYMQHVHALSAHPTSPETTLELRVAALEKAGVLDRAIAQDIHSWLTLRDTIMQGSVSLLDRNQIKDMIQGTRLFLSTVLRRAAA